jgi:hypothetical protein
MLSIKEAKMVLAQLGLTEEQTGQFETLIAPHIEFHKFLMEKLDITSEGAEKLTEAYSKTYIIGKIEDFKKEGGDIYNIDEAFYFKIAGEAMKSVALENGYDEEKSIVLESNMIELTNMFVSIVERLNANGQLK